MLDCLQSAKHERLLLVYFHFCLLLWPPNRASRSILVLWFLLSFFFLLFFLCCSQRLDIECLPYFHTWCGLSVNLECTSEMCYTQLAENTACKNYAKNCHLRTIAELCQAISLQLRHVSTVRKVNLLNTSISSTCPHNMVNIGPLTAEIGLPVWGTPANFSGFRVLASLLQRHRSTEVSRTLHDVWPFPALVHYIYIFGVSYPLTEFYQVQNHFASPSLVFSYICSITAWHSSSGH